MHKIWDFFHAIISCLTRQLSVQTPGKEGKKSLRKLKCRQRANAAWFTDKLFLNTSPTVLLMLLNTNVCTKKQKAKKSS